MARVPRSASGKLVDDPSPTLAADIKMNGHDIAQDGNKLIDFTGFASAVNHIAIKNGVASVAPKIEAAGADTDVDLVLSAKSSFTGNEPAVKIMASADWDSSADGAYLQAESGGADASLVLRTKGAGKVYLYDSALNMQGQPLEQILASDAKGSNKSIVDSNGGSFLRFANNNGASGAQQFLQIKGSNFNSAGQHGPRITVDSDNALVGYGSLGIETVGRKLTLAGLSGSTGTFTIDTLPTLGGGTASSLALEPYGASGQIEIKQAGNTTGLPAKIAAEGADTNIDLSLLPKGTGSVVLPGDIKVDSSDVNMPDEKGIKFGSQNDNRFYWSEATHFGSFVWDSAAQAVLAMTGGLELYGNTQVDGNGDWSPLIQWGTNGSLTLQVDSTAATPELRLTADSGVIVTGDAVAQDTAQGTGNGTTNINFKSNNIHRLNFGPQNEVLTFTAPAINTTKKTGTFKLILVQDGVGSRTVTWPTNVKWPGGVAPTLSTAANAVDIITFVYEGIADVYYGTAELNFQ